MAKTKAIILVCGLLLVFQLLTVANALSPSSVSELQLPRPLGCPGDPPAIPDSPFIESLTLKPQYNQLTFALVNGAFCSRPESYNWNSAADLNFDCVIDIFDAIIVATNR